MSVVGRPSVGQRAVQAIMIVVPLVSLGLAGWVPPVWAGTRNDNPAVRRRCWQFAVMAAVSAVVGMGLFGVSPKDRTGTAYGVVPVVGFLFLVGAMAIGVGVAIWQRRCGVDAALRAAVARSPEVEEVKRARALRGQYRGLAARDSDMAREIRVGRPDLARSYSDGGLLDFNAMPPDALVRFAGLSPSAATAVVSARDAIGRLDSVDDLVTLAGVDVDAADCLRDYAIFL